MYKAVQDPYCYPGSTVLRNRLNLRSQAKLEEFETFITAQRADEPLPAGRLSYRHFRAIHRHLFQDVYPWAGRIRTVRIAKQGSMFAYPEHIDREMRRLFARLAAERCFRGLDATAFAANAAHFLAELNAIHPFREGNGRTQLTFLALIAERAGHPLALERLRPAAVLTAMIKSLEGKEPSLVRLISNLIRPGVG
jgi:cell filamentation protein, protein adenylyltransferase